MPERVGADEQSDEGSRLFLAVSYLALFVLGGLLGLWGAFLLPAGPRIGDTVVLPLGMLVAVIGNPLASYAGLLTAGTRLGGFTPLLGWLLVVLPLANGRAEGDLVLTNDPVSIIFLLVGTLASTAVATLVAPRRGWSRNIGP